MEQQIKILALTNGTLLISQIEEVAAVDIGDPNCKMTSPYVINGKEMSHCFSVGTDDLHKMICYYKNL